MAGIDRTLLQAALLLTSGCGLVLGVDDYAVERSDPGSGGAGNMDAGGPLPLPSLPDANRIPDCTTCVRTNCTREATACRNNPRCLDRLECQAGCSDPKCIAACTALPFSPAFDDYFSCAFTNGVTQCTDECNAGANWECTGHYRWDVPSDAPRYVDFQLGSNVAQLSGGRRIANCQDGNGVTAGDQGCGPFVELDAYGFAHLDEEHLLGGGSEQTYVFAVTGPSRVGNHRLYTRPVPPAGRMDPFFVEGAALEPLGITGDVSVPRTLIGFVQHDCLGTFASSKVELVSSEPCDSTFEKPCEEGEPCVQYCVGFAQCAEGFTGGLGVIANVPPAPQVGVRSCNVDRPLSRRTVSAIEGWLTTVLLYPMDLDEWGRWGE